MLFVLVTVLACLSVVSGGPLADYVNAPDPTYAFSYHDYFRGPSYSVIVVNMTSQRYTVPGGVTPQVWKHFLTICVPDDLAVDRASTVHLHINGGYRGDAPPTSIEGDSFAIVQRMCSTTGLVSAQLSHIPNQPLTFDNDPSQLARVEDQILAWGWASFLNNTDQPIWITRLAMVKAAVRAMDTIQSISRVGGMGRGCPLVQKFIISGASKRGWVTWLVPAVDDRVRAIVPMMMPIQNFAGGDMGGSINAGYRALGYWTFALQDYVNAGITTKINRPVFQKLTAIEDPIKYNALLHMPKLVVTATQDEFFTPDQPKFFWDQLIGEKHLYAVPDADHPIDEALSTLPRQFYRLANATAAFLIQVTSGQSRPQYSWNLIYSNTTASIEFRTFGDRVPSSVKLWRANTESTTQRDFRLINEQTFVTGQPANVPWIKSELAPTQPGYWIAQVAKPSAGWTGFLIEATYPIYGSNQKFRVTSNVNIVPDRYPFRPCYETNSC